MTECIGIVVGSDGTHWANVLTARKEACGGCHDHGGACSACPAASGKIESRVINPVGARTGDTVCIELASTHLFAGAALFYLLPVALMVMGAAMGTWAAGALGAATSAGAILGCLAGGIAGFGAVVAIGRSAYAANHLTPVIKSVVKRGPLELTPSCPRCHS
jgi:sigma-E factor negative regulatory protein RseC